MTISDILLSQQQEKLMVATMARYDPSHDVFHVQRVRKTALSLARSLAHENPDLLVAKDYALDLISDGRATLIVKIVENVSWTTEKKLCESGALEEWHTTCTELHCVQDADRLDAIGAFGIMRCAAYSAAVNRPLHAPLGRNDTAIHHFYDKLLHIQDRLKTEPGKMMGARRHQFMLSFLQQVEDEYDAEPILSGSLKSCEDESPIVD
ncbi:hypothetical protein EV363DRAFT_1409765 [Boletus edulis]|nr:hypothetical protein EV363DRAFT_1409765 [Boletus edulis]